ncbi:hypothetical protein Golax_000133 [Gossypium laxum]|uniref:Uncharacterized protein n=2 Tax=Gossypium TaxID=3633 RepID=A0A7J8XPS1_GOSAI|nr:hypothetical protein [Gossypium aridum]MBA0727113.1 hypothetical protein [Gossypium laxum]
MVTRLWEEYRMLHCCSS